MKPLTDAEFREIASYIKKNYGVDLERKRLLIEGRLGNYISQQGFASYHDYMDYVRNDPTDRALANLLNRLTTNHTYFMREEKHFEYYRDSVLPWIEETGDTDLRLWSAGCSSGQEPYTLSIFTLNYVAERGLGWDSVVLATDISEEALTHARAGVYPADDLAALPELWRDLWFEKAGDGLFRANERLRRNVAFKRFNLLDAFDVKKPFHLIMCRNVMIYFDAATKVGLVAKFHDALRPGGYLFIGHSESLTSLENDFEYVKPSIYRKSL